MSSSHPVSSLAGGSLANEPRHPEEFIATRNRRETITQARSLSGTATVAFDLIRMLDPGVEVPQSEVQ